MEEKRIDSINPHTGYGAVAAITIAVTVLLAYMSWVHNLLYEIDALRFFWAYWVSLVTCLLSISGVLFLLIITHVQALVVWTLWRIRRHGIESLDKNTIISIHNQNNKKDED